MSPVAANAVQTAWPPQVEVMATSRWAGIWASGASLVKPAARVDARPLAAMTLCLEVTLPPIGRRKAVRLWQGSAPPEVAVAFYAVADGRLRLIHGDVDIVTPPDFVRAGETVSLRYCACARGRSDVVDILNHDRMIRLRQRTGVARAARLDEALPRDPRFLSVCHVAAVAGFGLRAADLPAVSAGTQLMTDAGPRPVEQLAAGDMLTTVTGERRQLRWIERRPRLCLGRFAPVRLRAPYFGLERDLFLSPETRIMRDGPAVEYLFGTERVLVRAGDLLASPGALRDHRLPVRDFFHLMLDDHACIAVDRCGVETALLSDVLAAEDGAGGHNIAPVDRTPCLPVLDRSAAQALVAASARGRRGAG
ncbi:hypothetical protein HKCCSP123_09520 [Rhodobacterales bacterium HKCCSP123]|nr:hypothetical protein [Rhodobacterales bacterium HKCCSP123]